ncbi:conserved hypothetical protein [Altererythrobacter sp. B11]|uniref:hypothetical protein n=1 Tax=Altererythrobacter sp. B11 TaxID=2060312 RepID=UPI000DC6F25F|nr:hypothetical protein [Altererythrobacter sp. B11]BBC72986.1 conserved hypothetical protein [Altererythrobacter sp. B11]
MARVCFLFNHDQSHQIAHSLPIALELAARGTHEVVLAAGSAPLAERLRQMAGAAGGRARIVELGLTRPLSRFAAASLQGLIPARKILLYRDNLDFFRGFQALVVTEKTSLLLKTRYGLDSPRIIHTRHGAGDRAIGFGPESARFDLVLVSGPKIARRLTAEAGVDPARIRVTGYPKFDLYGEHRIASPFPDPTRPTVLYAPHPSPRLSSYYRMGPALLRAFAQSDRYNLIFAPHVMLFQRRYTVTISPPALSRVAPVDPWVAQCPHILVDRGSPAATDMSYTNLADVYCGDVSSQVYEFLLHPRPVLHLDAHGFDWRDDPSFAHWHAGPVAGPEADILAEVDRAIATHGDYLPTQRALFADSFSVTDQPASRRAAQAIDEFVA